jgi:hypothetical protein
MRLQLLEMEGVVPTLSLDFCGVRPCKVELLWRATLREAIKIFGGYPSADGDASNGNVIVNFGKLGEAMLQRVNSPAWVRGA